MDKHTIIRTIITPLAVACAMSAMPATAQSTLERITTEKFVRLGLRTDTPPFAYIKDGKPAGFSVELCGSVVRAMMVTSRIEHLDGKFVPVDAERRFDALKDGEFDILCGATTATLSRREAVSFSLPTFLTGASAVVSPAASDAVKAALTPASPGDVSLPEIVAALGQTTVGVRAGTTAFDWVTGGPWSQIEDLTVKDFPDHGAGVAAAAEGTIDVYVADRTILQGLLATEGYADTLKLSPVTFTSEPYALAIRLGDEMMRLLVDRALSHLYRNGDILEIYARHFGEAPPDARAFYRFVALPE
jgi:polar amino acid transport system substrate-binding protein